MFLKDKLFTLIHNKDNVALIELMLFLPYQSQKCCIFLFSLIIGDMSYHLENNVIDRKQNLVFYVYPN